MENEDVGFGILSKNILVKYDYAKTRKCVDDIMEEIEELRFKVHSIQPPRITPSYEIRYESSSGSNTISKVENYVVKVADLDLKAKNLYDILKGAFSKMNKDELLYFKSVYFNKISERELCSKTFLSNDKLKRIKESCIIKVGLEFDIAVLSTRNG